MKTRKFRTRLLREHKSGAAAILGDAVSTNLAGK